MKRTLDLPSVETINLLLTYDPVSGNLFWKERPRSSFKTNAAWLRFNRTMAGKIAGHKHRQKDGRPTAVVIRGTFDGKDCWFLAHRLIYAMMGVEVPAGMEIDHKNLNPFDNSWENLRIATPSQNMANKPSGERKRKDHFGLPKGVTKWGKRFKTQIALGGKKRHVGVYDTPEEAGAAYMEEARKAVGEFARG